jgi:hypothetical protein
MDYAQYIKPELLILVPVLSFIGMGLKKSYLVYDENIPLILGIIGIVLSGVWVVGNHASEGATLREGMNILFIAVVQGVLAAGAAVYGHQMVKQKKG